MMSIVKSSGFKISCPPILEGRAKAHEVSRAVATQPIGREEAVNSNGVGRELIVKRVKGADHGLKIGTLALIEVACGFDNRQNFNPIGEVVYLLREETQPIGREEAVNSNGVGRELIVKRVKGADHGLKIGTLALIEVACGFDNRQNFNPIGEVVYLLREETQPIGREEAVNSNGVGRALIVKRVKGADHRFKNVLYFYAQPAQLFFDEYIFLRCIRCL